MVDGDPEETERRSELARYVHQLTTTPTAPDCHCSTFEKIEELSNKLLAKSTVARFVDKGEDSKVVARLIERLREAIVSYQVGNRWTPASKIADRGVDIAAASNLPPNNSPRGRVFPTVSRIGVD